MIFDTRFDASAFELYRSLPKEKKCKSNWINERRIRWSSHEIIWWSKTKKYSYLKGNTDKDKKAKGRKLLEAAQIKNKITHLEKHKIDVDTLKEDQREFLKTN